MVSSKGSQKEADISEEREPMQLPVASFTHGAAMLLVSVQSLSRRGILPTDIIVCVARVTKRCNCTLYSEFLIVYISLHFNFC